MKKALALTILAIAYVTVLLYAVPAHAARTDGLWNERLSSYVELIWPEGRNLLMRGTDKYINFGVLSGTSGYGVRDNGGTIECKNSGGSWSACQDGVGGGSGSGSTLHATTSADTFVYPQGGRYHSAPYYSGTSTTASSSFQWASTSRLSFSTLYGRIAYTNMQAPTSQAGVVGSLNTSATDMSFIPAGTDGGVLRRSGVAIDFGTLNLASDNAVTGALDIANGGTGATTFPWGWVYSPGGVGVLSASSSPTVGYVTATSTTASTFPYASSTAYTITNLFTSTVKTGTWNGSTIGIAYGGTNATSFGSHMLMAFDGTSLVSTSTPTAARYIATSTTASVLPYASTTAASASMFWGPLTGNVTGTASLATALAANGSNCSAGNFPLGVDASGAVETCTDAWTEAENTSAAYVNAAGTMTGTYDGNNFAGGAIGAGDMLYGGSAGSLSELTLGASSTILTNDGTSPRWLAGSALCVAITGSSALCDGDDASGAGGSGPIHWLHNGTYAWSSSTISVPAIVATSTATSSFVNLGGVLDATQFSGADIGAQINAAYAALPPLGGRIKVPRGNYSFSTAIAFTTADKPVMLECEPDGATSLTYTGSATSTTYNVGAEGITADTHYAGGIDGCDFMGPGNTGSSAWLEIGGTQGASGFTLTNTRSREFGIGLYINSNTYIIKIDNNFFNWHGRDVVFKSGGSNMGEGMRFTNNTFVSYGTKVARCFDTGTYQTSITSQGNSYDDCQVYIGAGTLHFDSIGDHFENPSGNSNDKYTPVVIEASPDGLGSVSIRGATFVQQSTTKVPVAYIENRGSNLEVYSATTWSDSAPVAAFVEATTTNANTVLHSITAEAGSLTSIINSKFTTSLTDGFDYVSSKGGLVPFAWNASSTGSTYFYASSSLASMLDNQLGWTQYGTVTAPYFTATSTTKASTFPYASSTAQTVAAFYITSTADFSNATVKMHRYPSFSWPAGTANGTTTTATTTIPLGTAYVANTYNGGQCWSGSGTIQYQISDGTNKTTTQAATTTVSQYAHSTNNTFTSGEKRFIEIGPITASYLSCSFDITEN